jgi:membrane carboxypeptidase/penicillin-binding protein
MRDAWFVGYTPALTAGVWVGRDSNKPLGLTGGASAALIWGEFMQCIQSNDSLLVASDFIAPRDVQSRLVDAQTGELASPSCPSEQVVQEIYVSGTEPRSLCPLHN